MSDTKASKGRLLGLNSRVLSAIVCASIAIAIFSTWNFSSTAAQTTEDKISTTATPDVGETIMVASDHPRLSPVDAPRTGVPMLVAYPLAMLPEPHVELDEAAYPWIERTIRSGETAISEQELKEYWDVITTSESHYFALKSGDGTTKWYSIEFYELPIVLEQYNAKAYTLDVPPEKFITIRLEEQPWLKNLVEDSHTWKPLDVISAKAFKELTDTGNEFNFKVIYDDGHEEYYNIRYAGPALTTLS